MYTINNMSEETQEEIPENYFMSLSTLRDSFESGDKMSYTKSYNICKVCNKEKGYSLTINRGYYDTNRYEKACKTCHYEKFLKDNESGEEHMSETDTLYIKYEKLAEKIAKIEEFLRLTTHFE